MTEIPGNHSDSFKPALSAEEVNGLLKSGVVENEQEALKSAENKNEVDYEELAMNDPRILENAAHIRKLRVGGNNNEANRLVAENKALLAEIVHEMKQNDGSYKSPEQIEAERQVELSDVIANLPEDQTDDEILRAFGLLDEDGKAQIDSPLFHDSTKIAFAKYLSMVRRFSAASQVEAYGVKIKDIGKADRDRSEAHDMTAQMVSRDLGMPFDASRSLVAKIREEQIPGSGEMASYGIATRRAIADMEKTGGIMGDYTEATVNALKNLDVKNQEENQVDD